MKHCANGSLYGVFFSFAENESGVNIGRDNVLLMVCETFR